MEKHFSRPRLHYRREYRTGLFPMVVYRFYPCYSNPLSCKLSQRASRIKAHLIFKEDKHRYPFLCILSRATITYKLHPSVCLFYIDTERVILKDGIIQQICSIVLIDWIFFRRKVQGNSLIVKPKFANWKIEGYLRAICFLYCISPINTLMFLKNIWLIEKSIRTFEDKHTVDCLQTIGVCRQSTVCWKSIYTYP